ncbi:MAG TPA: cysteine--tRNA ligase [Streptosporangiaceae bacterium]
MLRLYDTKTRQAEPIGGIRRGELRMYTCGPMVNRYAHLGDLRSYLLSDLIRRAAERRRMQVVVCQNITDVWHPADDDEIDSRRHYEDAFRADLAALNIRPADHTPRTSESLDLMIDMIGTLIDGGHAYATADGSVLFDARSFAGYGELSGHRPGDDWALWEGTGGHQGLTWTAPWGAGFPGRHTECPAMLLHHLGEHVDIQTGGIDLLFPHHENERAQCNSLANSLAGREVVAHWVHGEHLLFEGRKVSKSADVVLLSDLADRGLDPLALRLAFLEQRYRQQLSLSWDTLAAADRTLRRWRERVAGWADLPSAAMPAGYADAFTAAFDDDLDTPAALRELRALERDEAVPAGAKFEAFAHLDQLIGLDLAREVGKPR